MRNTIFKPFLLKLFLFNTFLLHSNPVIAQTYNCGGTLSNRPCDQQYPDLADTEANRKKEERQKNKELRMKKSRMRSIYHELSMSNIRARENYGFSVDTSSAQRVCSNETSSIEDCQGMVQQIASELEAKISAKKRRDSDSEKTSGNRKNKNLNNRSTSGKSKARGSESDRLLEDGGDSLLKEIFKEPDSKKNKKRR